MTTKTCEECWEEIKRGQHACIVDSVLVDTIEFVTGTEFIEFVNEDENYPKYFHKDCLEQKLM